MRLFLTSIFCSLALWTPAGADDPPCIDGFQTFPKKHVLGAADTLCADTEEECKQACAERTDCAAVDFNFGRNPWEGNRCWMHNVETLAASPMKTNRRTNHIVKCTNDEEHILAVGPSVDEPVDGYFGIAVDASTRDIPVIWTGFDTEYPEQEIVGLRANIHKSPGSKMEVYVTAIEKRYVGGGENYYDYRSGMVANIPQNGINTLFVNDSAVQTNSDLIMRPGMYLEIMVLSESEGDGIGYRNRNANCQSLTFTIPTNDVLESFGDMDQRVEWDMDVPCKEVALQLLYAPTDNTLP